MISRELTRKPLKLTNNGELSLFFLGVGTAFSRLHYNTNLLIIKGQDHLLVDCGSKTPQVLYELGVDLSDIHYYLITHAHADHIGGLEEAMITGRYEKKKKPSIVIDESFQQALWNRSLKGGTAYNEGLGKNELGFSDMWNIIRPRRITKYARDTYQANVGSIDIKIFRTMHFPDQSMSWQASEWSCGLIIDEKVLYTGDTRYDQELILSYCDQFSLETIFHDCQFFTGGIHASLEELANLPPEIKRKTFLIHYGDDWEQHVKKVKDIGFRGLAKQWHFYDF